MVRFLRASGNLRDLLRLKGPGRVTLSLSNKILFHTARYADWERRLSILGNLGCWRAGRTLRGNMPGNLRKKEQMWDADFWREMLGHLRPLFSFQRDFGEIPMFL